MRNPRMLGVLLCYNDGDVLPDSIEYMLATGHEIIVWDHGSTDDTGSVLANYHRHLVEVTRISRRVEFYDMYPLMSKHLMRNYIQQYDWISWPDQDEFLEGPTREKPFREFVREVLDSPFSCVEFRDFVYWYTAADDTAVKSPVERVRHYCLSEFGPRKIRAWRAAATNLRWFNHNDTRGRRYPTPFNLRHYPARSAEHLRRRLSFDRVGLRRAKIMAHYDHMRNTLADIDLKPEMLHFDNGNSPLNPSITFDWKTVFSGPQRIPYEISRAHELSTIGFQVAERLAAELERVLPPHTDPQIDPGRVQHWRETLADAKASIALICVRRGTESIVCPDIARQWEERGRIERSRGDQFLEAKVTFCGLPIAVEVNSARHSVRVRFLTEAAANLPLIALIPSSGGDVPRIANPTDGAAEFQGLRTDRYFMCFEEGTERAARVTTAP